MKEELSLDELAKVATSPNNTANYENAMNNKDLYRKQQIEELEFLKEVILKEQESEKKNTR